MKSDFDGEMGATMWRMISGWSSARQARVISELMSKWSAQFEPNQKRPTKPVQPVKVDV